MKDEHRNRGRIGYAPLPKEKKNISCTGEIIADPSTGEILVVDDTGSVNSMNFLNRLKIHSNQFKNVCNQNDIYNNIFNLDKALEFPKIVYRSINQEEMNIIKHTISLPTKELATLENVCISLDIDYILHLNREAWLGDRDNVNVEIRYDVFYRDYRGNELSEKVISKGNIDEINTTPIDFIKNRNITVTDIKIPYISFSVEELPVGIFEKITLYSILVSGN